MNKKAFTLIELIIVSTIILLTTGGGVFYFFKQISSLQLISEIEPIIDIVDRLDGQVSSKEILDYSLVIDKNTNQRGLNYTTNTLGLDYRQQLSFDSSSYSAILSTNQVVPGSSYAIKVYSGIKFETEHIIDGVESLTRNFENSVDYKITGTLSGSVLNTIYIHYYSPTNLDTHVDNYLELVHINSEQDKTGGSYNSVEIINENGKKTITGDGITVLNNVFLFFEKEGIENFIEIKN